MTSLLDDEVWRPITGYEQTHEVSNHGRVRSLARTVLLADPWNPYGGRNSPRQMGGNLLKVYRRSGGAYVTLSAHGRQHARKVSELVAEAFGDGSART